ncbi:hypothetical protein GUITHDRAFT_112297 [Guillardia theta CCMP2712]|uniref:Uncharacterized protein n=1 Tax=Guillardia theta (strain CCMP2712) TaxID=905079 RepID=L1IZB5_GUITC|nr:hypothetical protein GUITHDRAFT_112297 [Guillardia theta CCMP2712]EKX41586.1 hypothetical protein GUITHDRAFT_112297 [Guillardia theta CCMP2712]|eukprot:XP_005828566.1 hypothetical protein GUITHDRAFT_112297 [Guillardia theta CCMP2712]
MESGGFKTPNSTGWKVVDPPGLDMFAREASNHEHLLPPRSSTDLSTRALSEALARSIATITREASKEGSMSRIKSSQNSLEASPAEHLRSAEELPGASEAQRISQLRAQARELMQGLRERKEEPSGPFLYHEAEHDIHKAFSRHSVISKKPPGGANKKKQEAVEGRLSEVYQEMEGYFEKMTCQLHAWEAGLQEREKAIQAFQTSEFLEFALNASKMAERISMKEDELKLEEETLNKEKDALLEHVQDLQKIHKRLDQVEELHSWERSLSDRAAALHARENEIETRELDLARQQMYVEQREREVQMKMISTKEIRNEINNELLQWEADLKQREMDLDTRMRHMASQSKKQEINGQENRLRQAWSELDRERN